MKKKIYRKQKFIYVIYAKKDLVLMIKNIKRLERDPCHYNGKYRRAVHDICNLKYKTPTEIRVVFHNGSTYDYHFIIKELAEESKAQFE